MYYLTTKRYPDGCPGMFSDLKDAKKAAREMAEKLHDFDRLDRGEIGPTVAVNGPAGVVYRASFDGENIFQAI